MNIAVHSEVVGNKHSDGHRNHEDAYVFDQVIQISEKIGGGSLEALCRGRTTIVVAHRLTTIKHADEILVITDEGIAERGKHTSLLEQNGIYAGLWNGIVSREGDILV